MSSAVATGVRTGLDPLPDRPLPLREGPRRMEYLLAGPELAVPSVRSDPAFGSGRGSPRGRRRRLDRDLLGLTVGRSADPDESAREFVELWSAPTADALHRVLVLHQPIRGSADVYEPLSLLEKHHEAEPAGSVVTATLLLTDRRWRKGVGQLVRRIAESTILEQD